MDKLEAAQEKTLQKLHKAQEEEKQIRKRMAELTRNGRIHRLCTRGGYLEKLLIEPELFTEEDVFACLDYDANIKFNNDPLDNSYISEKGDQCPTRKTKARWKAAAWISRIMQLNV